MSFNSNNPREDYIATTGQTIFTFGFKIYNDTDIKIWSTPSNTNTTVELVLNVDYTVTIDGDNGGNIVLTVGSVLNDVIVLQRGLAVDRLIEYQTSGDLLANTLNVDQEYQTYLVLDLQARLNSAITAPPGTPGFDGTLPPPLPEAYLRWDINGTALENDTIPPAWRDETLLFRNEAEISATNALVSENKAEQWAEEPEDVEVETGKYSALHWAAKAEKTAGSVNPDLLTPRTSTTGSSVIPTGTTAQQDVTPAAGYFRFNSDDTSFEGYNGTKWGSIGGGAVADMFYENAQVVAQDYTITATRNAMSASPVDIPNGITVTVEDGAVWILV